jgi:L-fucose isomerase-like protein
MPILCRLCGLCAKWFFCAPWARAKAFLPDITIATATILGTTLGEKNTYGALAGRTRHGPVTFGRVSTDDPLNTFGTRAVVHVPELQKLMRFVCRNGFEHHAAMNASHCAGILTEAMDTYLGWDVHRRSRSKRWVVCLA